MESRYFLGSFWLVVQVIAVVYDVLVIDSLKNVSTAWQNTAVTQRYWMNGVIGAFVLSVAVTIGLAVVSILLFLKKLFQRMSPNGFGYGFVLASTLHSASFLLLSGLVYTASIKLVQGWEDSNIFKGFAVFWVVLVLAYVLAASYLALAILFIIYRSRTAPPKPAEGPDASKNSVSSQAGLVAKPAAGVKSKPPKKDASASGNAWGTPTSTKAEWGIPASASTAAED